MRKMLIAAVLLSAASITAIAIAQTKPLDPNGMYDPVISTQAAEPSTPMIAPAGGPSVVPDARAIASDQEVGEARRAYRASCSSSGENAGFCDCVTAGVAQVLMPSEVRIAARTFGERIPAQGDGYAAAQSDMTPVGSSSAERIEQVEAHYADACSQFR
jgi:hypothetical protein